MSAELNLWCWNRALLSSFTCASTAVAAQHPAPSIRTIMSYCSILSVFWLKHMHVFLINWYSPDCVEGEEHIPRESQHKDLATRSSRSISFVRLASWREIQASWHSFCSSWTFASSSFTHLHPLFFICYRVYIRSECKFIIWIPISCPQDLTNRITDSVMRSQ